MDEIRIKQPARVEIVLAVLNKLLDEFGKENVKFSTVEDWMIIHISK
jgi:hypothetical protein